MSDSKEPSPLHRAMADRNIDEMFRLLDNGADVNERSMDGESLLDAAISTLSMYPEHPDLRKVAAELLRRGADPKVLTPDGTGPLFSAVIAKDAEIMQWLLEAGAEPNAEHEGPEHLYDWAVFDYLSDEYDLDLPEEPTPDDDLNADSWLAFLERLAVKYHKRPPDYLRVLRDHGAKTWREME